MDLTCKEEKKNMKEKKKKKKGTRRPPFLSLRRFSRPNAIFEQITTSIIRWLLAWKQEHQFVDAHTIRPDSLSLNALHLFLWLWHTNLYIYIFIHYSVLEWQKNERRKHNTHTHRTLHIAYRISHIVCTECYKIIRKQKSTPKRQDINLWILQHMYSHQQCDAEHTRKCKWCKMLHDSRCLVRTRSFAVSLKNRCTIHPHGWDHINENAFILFIFTLRQTISQIQPSHSHATHFDVVAR